MNLLATVILLLLHTSPAFAQESPEEASEETSEEDAYDEAREVYNAGVSAYDVGQYDAALDLFQEAYELTGFPELLYNIALAAERVHEFETALSAYQRFLESGDDSITNERAVRARIDLLREAIVTRQAPGSPLAEPMATHPSLIPQYPIPDPEPEPPPSPSVAPWLLGGASAAAIIVGGVLTGVGFASRSTIEGAADGSVWDQGVYDRSQWMPAIGIATLITGAVGLTIALILLAAE